ncbi:MAG: DUF2490 domain-containing protein [Bryobacteraceae bacterium]
MKLAALLLLASSAFAQTVTDNNANAWFMYFGDHPVAKSRWGIHLEGQWRRANLGATWQQLLLRPAINFQLTKNISLTGGYGFVYSHPYGDFPALGNNPEHRVFEQVLINRRIGKLDFANRFRLEQRHIGVLARQADGSYHADSFRYENRVRYQIRTTIPLKVGDRKNYLALADEIKFNFGKNVEKNVFDQNRAYIALGRDLGHQTKFEFGFLEQTVQRRGGVIFEHNHTLQFAIFSKIPFFGE